MTRHRPFVGDYSFIHKIWSYLFYINLLNYIYRIFVLWVITRQAFYHLKLINTGSKKSVQSLLHITYEISHAFVLFCLLLFASCFNDKLITLRLQLSKHIILRAYEGLIYSPTHGAYLINLTIWISIFQCMKIYSAFSM